MPLIKPMDNCTPWKYMGTELLKQGAQLNVWRAHFGKRTGRLDRWD